MLFLVTPILSIGRDGAIGYEEKGGGRMINPERVVGVGGIV